MLAYSIGILVSSDTIFPLITTVCEKTDATLDMTNRNGIIIFFIDNFILYFFLNLMMYPNPSMIRSEFAQNFHSPKNDK